jgi:hypothetical protein
MPLPPSAHTENDGRTLVVDESFFPRREPMLVRSLDYGSTPIFHGMILDLINSAASPRHAVFAMLRAESVRLNGPTPPSTRMQRVVSSERAGLMPVVDEHSDHL